jgi:autotransporter-associated beta strand protein
MLGTDGRGDNLVMHRDFRSPRGRPATVALIVFLFAPACAQAAQYFVDGRQSQTDYLPGTLAVLATPGTPANPSGTNYLSQATDMWGDVQSYYSYAAVLDTGASGNVISAVEAQGRNLPTTGETYSDVGIGGTEWFNVSQPTQLKLASVNYGYNGAETLTNYSSYGNYKFQLRQQDPVVNIPDLGSDPIYVNVVGTPVINQHVMHAMPNASPFAYAMDAYGASPVNYVPTELLASAPGNLNAANSQLVLVPTSGGALHVPLSYQNFITGAAPPSTSTNPTIPGVQVIDSRKPANQQSAPSSWLFDSGAAVTMVGRDLATAIGINLSTETPVATTTILGIGGDVRTINGYQVQELAIPVTGGDQLVFNNIVVFVPGTGDLPADLPGILGMNLLNKSFSGFDDWGDPLNLTNSAFNDWYVVPVKGAYWTGTGTWDTSTTTTWAATSGGTYSQAWTAGADAIFEGTAGTVTVASAGVSSVNSITFNTDGYTLSGTGAITLTGNGSITTGAGTDTINCPLAGSVGMTKNGAGTLILSGMNTYTGGTTINAGTLQVGNGGTTGSLGGDITNYGALSFNRSNTMVIAGTISGTGSVTQQGSGRVILTGASSYTGATTVQSGALQINNASSTMNVLTNAGGVNVTGGFLVLDYSGSGVSVGSTVQNLLKTAYASGFQSGQIRDTSATANLGLGWVDNATTHQITVMPALYGDANLDGVVTAADLGRFLANYNGTGTYTWSQGDFTYDGKVTAADLGKLLANFNQSGPLNINLAPAVTLDSTELAMLAAHDITVSTANPVPEPSSLIMLASLAALGGAWDIRRRRRDCVA